MSKVYKVTKASWKGSQIMCDHLRLLVPGSDKSDNQKAHWCLPWGRKENQEKLFSELVALLWNEESVLGLGKDVAVQ